MDKSINKINKDRMSDFLHTAAPSNTSFFENYFTPTISRKTGEHTNPSEALSDHKK